MRALSCFFFLLFIESSSPYLLSCQKIQPQPTHPLLDSEASPSLPHETLPRVDAFDSPQPALAEQLKLRILPEASPTDGTSVFFKVPALPVLHDSFEEFPGELALEQQTHGHELCFTTPIPTHWASEDKSKKDLFFVWPKDAFSSPIERAFYSFHSITQDPHHIRPHQQEAYEDTDYHRWFIPIASLVKYGRSSDSANQILILSLLLKNQIFITLHIFFRIAI